MKMTFDDLSSLWRDAQGVQDAPHRASKIRCEVCGKYSHFEEWVKQCFNKSHTIQTRKYICPCCKNTTDFKKGIIWT